MSSEMKTPIHLENKTLYHDIDTRMNMWEIEKASPSDLAKIKTNALAVACMIPDYCLEPRMPSGFKLACQESLFCDEF